jgi:hypothetical protein
MHIYIKILLFLIFIDLIRDLFNSTNNFERSTSYTIGVILATVLMFLYSSYKTSSSFDKYNYDVKDLFAGFFICLFAGFLFHHISSYIKSYKVK